MALSISYTNIHIVKYDLVVTIILEKILNQPLYKIGYRKTVIHFLPTYKTLRLSILEGMDDSRHQAVAQWYLILSYHNPPNNIHKITHHHLTIQRYAVVGFGRRGEGVALRKALGFATQLVLKRFHGVFFQPC